jgi:sugar lactone lactonase YvrE
MQSVFNNMAKLPLVVTWLFLSQSLLLAQAGTRKPTLIADAVGVGFFIGLYPKIERGLKIKPQYPVSVLILILILLCFTGSASSYMKGTIYWTEPMDNKISRMNLNSMEVEEIVTKGLAGPERIAIDAIGGKIYWTDQGTHKIQRSNLDGSEVEDIIVGLVQPYGIAVDTINGKIIWSDLQEHKIRMANLDGTEIIELVTEDFCTTPFDISIDHDNEKIYWADRGRSSVLRSDLNGGNVEEVVTTGLMDPTTVALDMVGSKLYWGDWGIDKIQKANLDGTEVEDVITVGIYDIRDISLDIGGGNIYWTDSDPNDWRVGYVWRADLDGAKTESIVTVSPPRGIALDVTTPIADFSAEPLSGQAPLTVDFTDKSGGKIEFWEWDFGDGSPLSSEQNPTHIYQQIGNHTVSLTVSNSLTSDTETKTDYITVTKEEFPWVIFYPAFTGRKDKQ